MFLSFDVKHRFQNALNPPTQLYLHTRQFYIIDEQCSVQGDGTGTCAVYFKCKPLLQLLSNLKQPFPPEIGQLMKGSLLCGFENIGGLNLPKVCCPTEAVTKTDEEK